MTETALAIDFGTSRTKVGWRDANGNVELLWFEGKPYLPTIFYLPRGSDEILLGNEANAAFKEEPKGGVDKLKREIAQDARKSIHTTENRAPIQPKDLLVRLFEEIERHAVQQVDCFRGRIPEEVWLMAPGNADIEVEMLLKLAAREVGWDRAQIISEPAAAARYWLYGEGYSEATESMVVVLDCGGGTTDWACLQRSEKQIFRTREYTPGAINRGGVDVDEALYRWVYDQNLDHAADPQIDPQLRTKLREQLEPHLRDKLRIWKEETFKGENPKPLRINGKQLKLNAELLEILYQQHYIDKILPEFERFLLPIVKQHPDVPVLLVGGNVTDGLEAAIKLIHPKVYRSADTLSAVIKGALATAPKPPDDIHGWSADRVQDLQRRTARVLRRETVFQDSLKSGGFGPEMVVIPPGSFLMGSPETEKLRGADEVPHRVQITQAFAMGRYAVTFNDFDRFCHVEGRELPGDAGWGRGQHPVINVSWHDAKAYCIWLSQQTGKPYRLPTEAEWQYACRAGTSTPFSFGENITPEQVNYDGNYPYVSGKKGRYREQTVPAGSLPPNIWGLYEMHGNVWEWCFDWYDEYPTGVVKDPQGARQGNERVLCGGSWRSYARGARSASRDGLDPANAGSIIGFRVALAQPGTSGSI